MLSVGVEGKDRRVVGAVMEEGVYRLATVG